MGNPIPVVLAAACAAVLLLSWLLATTMPRARTSTRTIATAISLVIIGLVATSVGIARVHPGPAGRYAEGTALHWVHLHALAPGSYLTLLIPLCVAVLVAALRPQGGRRTIIIAVALSVLMIMPSLIIGLAMVCDHPGACP